MGVGPAQRQESSSRKRPVQVIPGHDQGVEPVQLLESAFHAEGKAVQRGNWSRFGRAHGDAVPVGQGTEDQERDAEVEGHDAVQGQDSDASDRRVGARRRCHGGKIAHVVRTATRL